MQAEFAPSFFEDEVTKIDLWVYWRLVRKHLRLIGAVVAGTVFVTLIHLLMTTPIYTAKTTVMILPKAPSGIDPAEALLEIEASYDGSDYFKTQNEILKSRTLAASVVRNLGLNRNPAFTGSGGRPGLFGAVIGGLRQRLHDLLTPPPPGSSAPRSGLLGVSADQIDAYLAGLSITCDSHHQPGRNRIQLSRPVARRAHRQRARRGLHRSRRRDAQPGQPRCREVPQAQTGGAQGAARKVRGRAKRLSPRQGHYPWPDVARWQGRGGDRPAHRPEQGPDQGPGRTHRTGVAGRAHP